ncbi:recombination regulator RecX [Salinisphaera dokdonensis CL-ES53]|uniref:Regulatory protein RecX n=1 Tax=Salinisphaera dokdonensis CL-ES53 TaxID=1304272 RepID=A0ABV2B223_9GAMM
MIDDDSTEVEPLDPDAERLAIRKRAMDFLARREHAPAELAIKLAKRDHDRDTIATVLDELIDDGLLSESRYADAMVASRAARGIGPIRIRADLTAVKVSDFEIDRALEDAEVDWHALAEAVRRKRFGDEMPADFPAKAKQMRFLQRRGFDGDALQAAFED